MSTAKASLAGLPNELLLEVADHLDRRPYMVPDTNYPKSAAQYTNKWRSSIDNLAKTCKDINSVTAAPCTSFAVTPHFIRAACEFTGSDTELFSYLSVTNNPSAIDAWKRSVHNSAAIWVQPQFVRERISLGRPENDDDAPPHPEAIVHRFHLLISHFTKIVPDPDVCPNLKHIILTEEGIGPACVFTQSYDAHHLMDTEEGRQTIHDIANCRKAEVHVIDIGGQYGNGAMEKPFRSRPVVDPSNPGLLLYNSTTVVPEEVWEGRQYRNMFDSKFYSIRPLASRASLYTGRLVSNLMMRSWWSDMMQRREDIHPISFRLLLHPYARHCPSVATLSNISLPMLSQAYSPELFPPHSDITICVPGGEEFKDLKTAVERAVEAAGLVATLKKAGVSFQVKDYDIGVEVEDGV